MSAVPVDPTVLDTTVLSNFAFIGQMDLLAALPRVCSVPEVRRELRTGMDSYPYLQQALDHLDDTIPVMELDDQVVELIPELEFRLDPGEAQALAVASVHGGTLVSDDRAARESARSLDVSVTGSIGVLVTAVEDERIAKSDADRWLKQWVDETAYRAPSRELSDYL